MYGSTSPELVQLLKSVQELLPPAIPVYLVGGAVRDILLGREIHDLDFVLPAGALELGKQIANKMNAAYYPLDPQRETARVVQMVTGNVRRTMDFAVYRGPDLESDLLGRDFTINAMALDMQPAGKLIDPLGGVKDLHAKQLRACSPYSFHDDPVRILRGVRLAIQFNFKIVHESWRAMRDSTHEILRVSPERVRDELFRVLAGPNVVSALRLMDLLGLLDFILPELVELKGVKQSEPHVYDVWEHTLSVLRHLEVVLSVLDLIRDEEVNANLTMGLLSGRLGYYRPQLAEHLREEFTPERGLRPLLFLAALYHDTGKPGAFEQEVGGSIHFYNHERSSEELMRRRAQTLALSAKEVGRLACIVRHHMRLHHLVNTGAPPTPRAIYRYFRDTEAAGVDICLLTLADVLGTYGTNLPQERWGRTLDVVRQLLDAWWQKPQESVHPPSLVNGNELQAAFSLRPGQQIGKILELVREAQVSGEIITKAQALELAKNWLDGRYAPDEHQG